MNAQKTSNPEPASASIGDNPLGLLAAGVGIGLLVGGLLPRIAKERELLDPVGRQIADRATAAIGAVKEAGKAEIEALIPDKDATKDRVSALFGTIIDAAKSGAAPQKA